MKQLRGTKNHGMFDIKYPIVLEGYIDANWNALASDSFSNSGYVFILGCCAIC